MNLEFGILWIEDNPSPAEEQYLIDAAANAGFEAKITMSADAGNIDELADRQRRHHVFDLILLDLMLANNVRGDDIARHVRESFGSTPMLFYSSSGTVGELRNRMAANVVEGVFCAHRDDFRDRASELISEIAVAVNRLSGMRGLAARVVAECDILFRDIILASKISAGEGNIIAELDGSVTASMDEVSGAYGALENLESRLGNRAVDSMQLFKQVRRCTRGNALPEMSAELRDKVSSLRRTTARFDPEVLRKRNLLSHAIERDTENGWEIVGWSGEREISAADFPDLRRTFLEHLRAFRELHQILVEQQ